MGILPLQFANQQSAALLGLDGTEFYDFDGIRSAFADRFSAGREMTVRARRMNGEVVEFGATIRIDTPMEAVYYRHGGILQYMLRQLLGVSDDVQPLAGGVSTGADAPTDSKRNKVTESSMESFPASDPPSY
jgi:aconitate hydratase